MTGVLPEWPGELAPIVEWKLLFAQPHVARPQGFRSAQVRSTQAVTDHEELAKVHLGIFVLALVMPSMHFGHPKPTSQGADAIVQVRVLERELDAEQGEPCTQHVRRRAEQHRDRQARARHQQRTQRMTPLAVEPVETFGTVVYRMQPPRPGVPMA